MAADVLQQEHIVARGKPFLITGRYSLPVNIGLNSHRGSVGHHHAANGSRSRGNGSNALVFDRLKLLEKGVATGHAHLSEYQPGIGFGSPLHQSVEPPVGGTAIGIGKGQPGGSYMIQGFVEGGPFSPANGRHHAQIHPMPPGCFQSLDGGSVGGVVVGQNHLNPVAESSLHGQAFDQGINSVCFVAGCHHHRYIEGCCRGCRARRKVSPERCREPPQHHSVNR